MRPSPEWAEVEAAQAEAMQGAPAGTLLVVVSFVRPGGAAGPGPPHGRHWRGLQHPTAGGSIRRRCEAGTVMLVRSSGFALLGAFMSALLLATAAKAANDGHELYRNCKALEAITYGADVPSNFPMMAGECAGFIKGLVGSLARIKNFLALCSLTLNIQLEIRKQQSHILGYPSFCSPPCAFQTMLKLRQLL